MNKHIVSIEKKSNKIIKVVYKDNSREILNVIKIDTREKAIQLCIIHTKRELKKESAFDNLGNFINKYDELRNYEIENYLDFLNNTNQYRILEKCPFNRFSWFD